MILSTLTACQSIADCRDIDAIYCAEDYSLSADAGLKHYDVDYTTLKRIKVTSLYDYNFSNIPLLDLPDLYACNFAIQRIDKRDQQIKNIAFGELQFHHGDIIFLDHEWFTGGLANDSYLKNLANVKFGKDKKLYGKMPVFFDHVSKNKLPRKPITAVFPYKYEGDGFPANSRYLFEAKTNHNGIFKILDCRKTNDE